MKICKFIINDLVRNGIIEDDLIYCTDQNLRTEEVYQISDVKFILPVTPSKIVCVGRNYAEHAAELGNDIPSEPLLFLKAPSSLILNNEEIIIPEQSEKVEHEGELGIIIGKICKDISANENVFDYVKGYICLNDITARDLQRKDVQFTRAKSFDTFCPISHFIETELDPRNTTVTTKVNGIIRQSGNTSQMVFPVDYLLRYISQQMTLLPGDIIATGTPSGVSKLEHNDICEVEIEGVGKLINRVVKKA
ncbi:MAG: fumarylacetoacetate hydrolase family protein [Pyrinomonadaceae bacterium]|nr:fumarylacetoacetate hydrolase family protein [Pyrinomonadaceae bacterium]